MGSITPVDDPGSIGMSKLPVKKEKVVCRERYRIRYDTTMVNRQMSVDLTTALKIAYLLVFSPNTSSSTSLPAPSQSSKEKGVTG